jgi:cell division protein FtsI (penicillin-binding protein 3)
VAVIIDTPKGSYYGASVSAPVFAEVAQQVLEYLGVSHDVEVRSAAQMAKDTKLLHEDDADSDVADMQALFEAANNLPKDDPLLSASAAQTAAVPNSAVVPASQSAAKQSATAPLKPQFDVAANPTAVPPAPRTVVISRKMMPVPSLTGLPLRKVIEQAGAAGFDVEVTGSGTARNQMPAAGTMVPAGTKIIVRCQR